jgi:hypothetical protein
MEMAISTVMARAATSPKRTCAADCAMALDCAMPAGFSARK